MATATLGPAYHRLWSATALTNLGDGVRAAALPLLAATLSSNPGQVAGVAVAGQVPWLAFGLVAGAIVDRVDRRRLVFTVDVARTALLTVLIVALAVDRADLVLVYLIAFVCGIGETLRDTAAGTLVPPLVDPAELDRANGRLINAEIAGNELLGPPLGGYLFGLAIVLPFALNTGMLAVGAALICTLPNLFTPPQANATDKPSFRRQIGDGLRWLANHRRLRALACTGIALSLADSAWWATLVLYVEKILHLPAAGFGVLIAIGALGGLAGGLAAARISRRLGSTRVVLGSLLIAAATQLALGLTSYPVIGAFLLATSSFAFALWNVSSMTLRQILTPTEIQGRVMAAFRTLLMGASALGALIGGVLATTLGLRAPLLLGVPLLLLAAAATYPSLRETQG